MTVPQGPDQRWSLAFVPAFACGRAAAHPGGGRRIQPGRLVLVADTSLSGARVACATSGSTKRCSPGWRTHGRYRPPGTRLQHRQTAHRTRRAHLRL